MKLVRNLIIVVAAILIIAPVARGQAVLSNTTLGQQQNDARDLANSLQAAPQKYGKGEKKSQINSAELKSKSIKDATFGGSLMNIGIDDSVPKLDAAKEHAAPTEEAASSARRVTNEQTSTAPKQTETKEQEASASASSESQAEAEPLGGSTFSSLSTTALLADDLNGTTDLGVSEAGSNTSSSNSAANTDKSQKKKTDEKPSSDKSSTTKPDGDH